MRLINKYNQTNKHRNLEELQSQNQIQINDVMPDSMSLIYIASERHFSDHNDKEYLVMQLFMLLSRSVGTHENYQVKL